MTPKEFVTRVAREMELPRDQVYPIFRQIFSSLSEILREGDELRVANFGTFYAARTEPKTHVDRFELSNGKEVRTFIPSRKKVKFRPCGTLQKFLQENEEDLNQEPPTFGDKGSR